MSTRNFQTNLTARLTVFFALFSVCLGLGIYGLVSPSWSAASVPVTYGRWHVEMIDFNSGN